MQSFRFDKRWVILFVVVIVMVNITLVPWFLRVLLFLGGGGYLLVTGWRVWQRTTLLTGAGNPRVRYWRGQRIELPATPRGHTSLSSLSLHRLTPALVYVLLGIAFVVAGGQLLLQHIGIMSL